MGLITWEQIIIFLLLTVKSTGSNEGCQQQMFLYGQIYITDRPSGPRRWVQWLYIYNNNGLLRGHYWETRWEPRGGSSAWLQEKWEVIDYSSLPFSCSSLTSWSRTIGVVWTGEVILSLAMSGVRGVYPVAWSLLLIRWGCTGQHDSIHG